jgi:two-component system, cell cycle response regulator DivK
MAGELILIVEDNEKNRKLERDVLQFHGYQTVEAETGEEGVRLAKASPPALVLMDIQLPGINGIQALGQLRADPRTRGIPVIAVTASAMTQDRQKIMAAGFDAYQSKPLNVKEFVAAVRQTLDQAPSAGGRR